jgi:hypothetical protein
VPASVDAATAAREALPCLQTAAEALGWLAPVEPAVVAQFSQVIETLVARSSVELRSIDAPLGVTFEAPI